MKMAIAEISLDPRCQMREALDQYAVREYAERYRAGDEMPPVSVFKVRKAIVCVDGFHRIAGALAAGETFIEVEEVGKGTMAEAQWHALSVNHRHGVRRTNADKRKAVAAALENSIGQEQSSRAIAKQCGVSHNLVADMRKTWEAAQGTPEVSSDDTLPGDGTPLDDDYQPGTTLSLEKEREVIGAVPQVSSDDTRPAYAADLEALADDVRGVRRRIASTLGDGSKHGLVGVVQAARQALQQAATALAYAVPVECPKCDGRGCNRCGTGWVPRRVVQEAAE